MGVQGRTGSPDTEVRFEQRPEGGEGDAWRVWGQRTSGRACQQVHCEGQRLLGHSQCLGFYSLQRGSLCWALLQLRF